MTPYASVILPTFNRSHTLPYALASVQAQTERALDIVIVLDGATDGCREVAVAAAQADGRIRVLDLPKAPGYGEENEDLAIRSALGERIFYIDDDDVWLPHHVASLGPLLEDADIADSRVCSVDRNGRFHLGPCRASNARMRQHLADFSLKILYDAHIAHRKDAYGRLSSLLMPRRAEYGVTDFLGGFAGNPECRWASHDAVTALSIHGAARTDQTPAQRAAEIAYWQGRAADVSEELSRADSAFHLFRMLMVDPPEARTTMEDYLAARGGYEPAGRSSRERDLFSLFASKPPDESTAVDLALFLSEPVESGYMFESVALAYFQAYGQDYHERILYEAQSKEGGSRAGCLAAYSVALSRRDLSRALFVAKAAVELGPDPVRSLARWHEGLLAKAA